MINIRKEPVEFYINKLKNRDYFSFPGFSDAEWLAMEKCKGDGETRTGGGQLFTHLIGDQLTEALRINEPNYLKAIPVGMWEEKWIFGAERMEKFLTENNIPEPWEFYERDMVTDECARDGLIGEWIKQLKEMDVVLISNKFVSEIKYFLPYKHFVEIPKLNVYMEENWLERYTNKILGYGKPAVYIFSAGFAAAPLIGNLHGKIPNSFFLDLGSIWDCFVGIGNQRGWRGELYNDRARWKDWIKRVLGEVDMDYAEMILEKGLNRKRINNLENG
ncbi:MAG: hypothetical protein U1C56_00460 [Candidatus Curtissbacteria bacterium]|nr:hypothetical protein [Candidatus Curtissbacteria bacterium]